MIKRCPISFFIWVILFASLLKVKVAYSQTCGSVTQSDITSTPATCPGNGTITAPTLASSTVFQLSGGSISGVQQQNSPVFESLVAGTYELTILCTGVPAQTFTVVVADKHSPLTMSLAGTMVCEGSGGIVATAGGGFNEGGTGANYQYAMWPASEGGANRADAALTYGSIGSFGGTLSAGDYYVRVKDNCGNIFTQSIQLKPSKPVADISWGSTTISCSGGIFAYNLHNVQLKSSDGTPVTNFDAPYYKYRIEKVSTAGSCESAAVESTITPNTDITSASAISDLSISGALPGARYRLVIVSPCGGEVTYSCLTTPAEVVGMAVKTSRVCAPVGGANIRVAISIYLTSGYDVNFPVTVTLTANGATTPFETIVANNSDQLKMLQGNVPETAFPITVVATDACGVSKTVVQNAPPAGAAPSDVVFIYTYNCVQDNGNVNVSAYPEGNWYGFEYNTGPDSDRTKYELVNATTNVVVSTRYGLTNPADNELFFPNVPAGESYFIRVTPPASVVATCALQESNAISIPPGKGLALTVSPTVEKVCNNGLNNIQYNVSDNSGGTLSYALYAGATATGTPVSTSATPKDLVAGTYTYVVSRSEMYSLCSPTVRTGTITVDAWETDPSISRSLSVNCQPLGSGPQATGSALLQFTGFGPFRVERSINGGTYTEVAASAVSSYQETSLVAGSTYNYRVTDQCGKSVSQQVMIKPLSPRLTSNTVEPCEGAPYTLSAIDFGDPLTLYTWEKVGTSGTLATTREYTFPNFIAADNGTYKLTVSLLNGCVVRETFVTLNSTNCGNPFATGSLGDQVWFDNNSDGVQDASETGAANVAVTLQAYVGPASPTPADLANNANWTDVENTVTDANGNYLFDGLETGNYRVKFGTIPNYGFTGYMQGGNTSTDSDAGLGGLSGAVFINALGTGVDKDNMTVDAGLVPAGSIGDYIWFDQNQNGKQDAGELPRSGLIVNLYVKDASNAWMLYETTATGSDGKYLFDGLLAGTYQVEFVLPIEYDFTYADKADVVDAEDSDADATTGKSGEITIDPSQSTGSILRNNLTIDAGIVDAGTLPVKLAWFEVEKGENVSAVLRWATTEEVNSDRFEVQRSSDAKAWSVIGLVASKINSTGMVTYRFDDEQPLAGVNYYRLKMVDKDESFAYSSIRQLSGETGENLTIYPNPVSNELSVLSRTGQGVKRIEFVNQNGRILLSKNSEGLASPINVKGLPAGIYLVKISFQNGSIETRKVVVVH